MKGMLITGGEGSRLWPTTKLYNKALALVYDRPMIDYPLQTLKDMGCDSVAIVSNAKSMGMITQHVKDGAEHGLDVEYRIQAEGTDIGGAIKTAKLDGVFPLMLGDCYYSPAPPTQTEPTLFWHDFPTGNQHSVWSPEMNAIFEKPKIVDIGKRAVVSYFYDEGIYDFIDSFSPGHDRGLEIVDIHNHYLQNGANMVEYKGFFGDMGTPDGLHRVASFIKQNGVNNG
jgi:glucose-1-phosphate thymidylyltransferase